jgi:hypothetical protein
MIRDLDRVLTGGHSRITAQKPQLWKAENFANDSRAVLPGARC